MGEGGSNNYNPPKADEEVLQQEIKANVEG
jgi:hypothetical protein